jgi:hypothetical protein
MLDPLTIVDMAAAHFSPVNDLQHLNIMITAGPTREPLDPVRYITNHSSGKMGFAIAAAAAKRGANVTLVSGPVSLPTRRLCSALTSPPRWRWKPPCRHMRKASRFLSAVRPSQITAPRPSPMLKLKSKAMN